MIPDNRHAASLTLTVSHAAVLARLMPMTRAYILLLVTHVLIAILGVGSVAAIAVISTIARRSGRAAVDASIWLTPLLRTTAFSLALMFITGASLDYLVGGAFHRMGWFRASVLLLVALGALNGLSRRAMRAGLATPQQRDASLRRIEWLAYTMCALIAAITALMEAKPF
jgi:uncharacterized membrane protein